MRLGWTTGKYSITYRAVKTVRINGKNKTQIVKSFGSEKYICETYGVTDAKTWAKEQVRQMSEAEKEDTGKLLNNLSATLTGFSSTRRRNMMAFMRYAQTLMTVSAALSGRINAVGRLRNASGL